MTAQLFIVVLGPPGAGKSTQSCLLSKRLGLCHISVGRLLRQAAAARGANAEVISNAISNAGLLPTELIVGMILSKLDEVGCVRGAVFDGIRELDHILALERTLQQRGGQIAAVFVLHVPQNVLVSRLTLRRRKDDVGESPRIDDASELLFKRFALYQDHIFSISARYGDAGILFDLDGDNTIDAVHTDFIGILTSHECL